MRLITFVLLFIPASLSATEASLRGSLAAMQRQHQVARSHGLQFYHTVAQINAAVNRGDLVRLSGNGTYDVIARYPFAQPEVRLFIERLSAQYFAACGQKLVVTSLVRPTTRQPANAHRLSVHPAGMAVDLRVSPVAACRSWLERTLLSLEARGVLNGIREFRPPHYHVAVFPRPYREYVSRITSGRQAMLEGGVIGGLAHRGMVVARRSREMRML
jgi:hypothetical protein